MPTQFQSAVIYVQDMAAARHFYETLLAQEVAMDHGPNVGFAGGFALWQVDHAHQITFGTAPASTEPLGRRNLELYFEDADVEGVQDRLTAAGVKLVHDMREQPWGQRVLRVYDPDGHVVEVGEPMPAVIMRYAAEGLDAAAIAERTSMPSEVVAQILAASA